MRQSHSQKHSQSHEMYKNPVHFAQKAGLRYVNDLQPGYTRKRRGQKFVYFDTHGRQIRDSVTLKRIQSLAIPPAYQDVWICPDSNGHLQATGRDARGRKQYRYHGEWRNHRDMNKYDRMMKFGEVLPKIRRKTRAHTRLPGLSREKVLGTVIQLLEKTLIRVGNEEYAKTNSSFGLTTMQDKHVRVKGSKISFSFRGKHKIHHSIDLEDPHLARIVKNCRDIPGQDLFQYYDKNGHRRDVKSDDVNAYLKEITGEDFTAKDFRTWAGTVLAALALHEVREFNNQTEAKRNMTQAIESVAKKLGNTKAICRKCYVHPEILDAYLDRETLKVAAARGAEELAYNIRGLTPDETAVLALLERRLKKKTSKAS